MQELPETQIRNGDSSMKVVKYSNYIFLYPPRPENKIMSGMLGVFEKQRYVAQIKKNGTGSIIAVSPDKEFFIKTRLGDEHKQWNTPDEILDPFYLLPKRWYYFCFELLHSKTKHIKNVMYLHDVLVANSNYLVGFKYADRYRLLHDLFRAKGSTSQYDIVTDNVLIANNYNIGFEAIFNSLTNDEDEGLVLKDPQAELSLCTKEKSNSSWQVKCRRF
jgi:hypothetical protein